MGNGPPQIVLHLRQMRQIGWLSVALGNSHKNANHLSRPLGSKHGIAAFEMGLIH